MTPQATTTSHNIQKNLRKVNEVYQSWFEKLVQWSPKEAFYKLYLPSLDSREHKVVTPIKYKGSYSQ